MNKSLKLAIVVGTVLFAVPSYGMFRHGLSHIFRGAAARHFSSTKRTINASLTITTKGKCGEPRYPTTQKINFCGAHEKELLGETTIKTDENNTTTQTITFFNYDNSRKKESDIITDDLENTLKTVIQKTKLNPLFDMKDVYEDPQEEKKTALQNTLTFLKMLKKLV